MLAHGLIRASFVPPRAVQELRDLTRTRKQLVREISQHTLRVQKTLEDAGLKLASVISDVLGASPRGIINALKAGETDPERLVQHAGKRLKASRAQLLEALRGHASAHHRFLLGLHLAQVEVLERTVLEVGSRLGEAIGAYRAAAEHLMTIPGVSQTTAQTILAEVGAELARFPTAGHLVSWAGLCPRLDLSAGKKRSRLVRRGSAWLKTALVQAAWGAVRSKENDLRAQFFRLRSRRTAKKAVVAVAASILTAAFHILRDGVNFRDLGGDYFDRLDRDRVARRLVQRLEGLGLRVTVSAVPDGLGPGVSS